MKKLILLGSVCFIVFLIALKEPPITKSFSQIVKENPKRIPELLATADSINVQQTTQPDPDEIDEQQINKRRKKGKIVLDPTQDNLPIAIVSAKRLKKYIGHKPENEDSIILYFSTIKDDADVTYYNDHHPGTTPYTLKDLEGRPTVLFGKRGPSYPSLLKAKPIDIARICPPPSGSDCN